MEGLCEGSITVLTMIHCTVLGILPMAKLVVVRHGILPLWHSALEGALYIGQWGALYCIQARGHGIGLGLGALYIELWGVSYHIRVEGRHMSVTIH